jgi:hypothetical protein
MAIDGNDEKVEVLRNNEWVEETNMEALEKGDRIRFYTSLAPHGVVGDVPKPMACILSQKPWLDYGVWTFAIALITEDI